MNKPIQKPDLDYSMRYDVVSRAHRWPICVEYVIPYDMLEKVELQAALIAMSEAPELSNSRPSRSFVSDAWGRFRMSS